MSKLLRQLRNAGPAKRRTGVRRHLALPIDTAGPRTTIVGMKQDARLLASLAALIEPLAEYMIADLTPEEWQDSPLVDRVRGRVPARGERPGIGVDDPTGPVAGGGGARGDYAKGLSAARKPLPVCDSEEGPSSSDDAGRESCVGLHRPAPAILPR